MKTNLFKKSICFIMSMLMLFTLFSSQLALATTEEHDHTDGSSCSDHEHGDEDIAIRENHLLTTPDDSIEISFADSVNAETYTVNSLSILDGNNLDSNEIEHECIWIGDSVICSICKAVKEHTCEDNPLSLIGACIYCGEHMCRWTYTDNNQIMECHGCGATKERETPEHTCTWTYTAINDYQHKINCQICGNQKNDDFHDMTVTTDKQADHDNATYSDFRFESCKHCNCTIATVSIYKNDTLYEEVTSRNINGKKTVTTKLYTQDMTIVREEVGNNIIEEKYYSSGKLMRTLRGEENKEGEWELIIATDEEINEFISKAKNLSGIVYSTKEDYDYSYDHLPVSIELTVNDCTFSGYGVNYASKEIKNIWSMYKNAGAGGVLADIIKFMEATTYDEQVAFAKDQLLKSLLKIGSIDAEKNYNSYEFFHTQAILDLNYDLKAYVEIGDSKQELFSYGDLTTKIFAYKSYGELGEVFPFELFGLDLTEIANKIKACPEGFVDFTVTEDGKLNNIFSNDYYRRLINEHLDDFEDYENINDSINCPKCLTGYTVIVPTGAGHYWKCSNTSCDFKSVTFNHDSVKTIDQNKHQITCRCKNSTEGHVFDSTKEQIDGNDAVHMRNCVLCGEIEVKHKYAWESDDYMHWEKCTDCGFERGYSTRATHVYTSKEAFEIISDTQHKTTCDVCGKSSIVDHKWGSETYDLNGHHKRCMDCDKQVRVSDHAWVTEKISETEHKTYCDDCGYESSTAKHTSDGSATKIEGDVIYHLTKCTVCNETYKVSHNFVAENLGASGHQQACICGLKAFYSTTHNLKYSFYTNSAVHTEWCDDCDYYKDNVYHTYETDAENTSHRINCDCGYTTDYLKHTRKEGTGASLHSYKHQIECVGCGKKFQEDHELEWKGSGSTWYQKCKYCNYTSANCAHSSYTYGFTSGYTYHTKKCSKCPYSIDEKHTTASPGEAQHWISYNCVCGHEDTKYNHTWTGSGSNYYCAGCGYVCKHGRYTYAYNDYQHTRVCGICKKYSVTSNHTTIAADANGHWLSNGCVCGRPDLYVKHTSDGSATKIKDNKSYHYTKCSHCKTKYLIGHTWKYTNITSTQHDGICKNCGYTKTVNHSWSSEYYSNNSSTHSKRCRFCEQPHATKISHTKTYYDITATTHSVKCPDCNLNNTNRTHTWELRANATKHYYACKYCNKVKPNSKEDHSYGSWKYKDASLEYRRCVICDKAVSEKTRSHSWGSWSKKDATYCTRKCSSCKQSQNTSHSFGSWGYRNTSAHGRTCSRCSYSPTASHTMSYVSTGSSQHQYKCTTCGWVSSTSSHTWGSSSDYNSSYHKRICTKCGGTKNEAHIYQYGKCSFCGRKS